MRMAGLALAVAVAGVAPLARAGEAAASPPSSNASSTASSAVEARDWYGWQTLIADGISVGFLAVGLAAYDSRYQHPGYRPLGEALAAVGAAGVIAGAPLVHGVIHHRVAPSMLSLGLRVLAPVLGATIGLGIGASACGRGPDDSEACPAGAAIIGLIAGGVVASVADATVLAHDDSPAPSRTNSALVPGIAIAKDGFSVGVGGRF